jgi:hypothetical protein
MVPISGMVTWKSDRTSRRKASNIVGPVDLVDQEHGRRPGWLIA